MRSNRSTDSRLQITSTTVASSGVGGTASERDMLCTKLRSADGCPHHIQWFTTDEHIARLAQSEGVDLALSKLGVRLELVAESITRALALKRGKRDSKESITRRSRHSVKGSYGQFDRRVRQHSI